MGRTGQIETTITKIARDFRIRVGYGLAFALLLISYVLTLYANSELLRQARLVQTSHRLIPDGELAAMSGRYQLLNNVIFLSIGMAILMAVFAFITYTKENKARRTADERAGRFQEQLQERIRDLDKANKALVQMRSAEKFAVTGRIARTLAHEVRNPLTNINLAVEQLEAEIDDHPPPGSQVLLGMIHRNSDRINFMITDLLNSTKFTDLWYQTISVNQLIDETLALAKDRIRLNHIILKKAYMTDGCTVNVDVKRMQIALLNIIVNALEVMEPHRGILEIRTYVVNHKCFVAISDNGPGIDEDSLSKVFEPYFTSKNQGTGLGLTNTQNIVLNHNGMINLESRIGMGTTFTVQLELAS